MILLYTNMREVLLDHTIHRIGIQLGVLFKFFLDKGTFVLPPFTRGTRKKTCLVCADDDVGGGQCPWPGMKGSKICDFCATIMPKGM
jgi:hypothetical protein